MNAIYTCQHGRNLIDIVIDNGQAYFCLTDIMILSNLYNPIDKLKTMLNLTNMKEFIVNGFNGKKERRIFIDETDLCRMVFYRNKKADKDIQEWVIKELLPTIHQEQGAVA